MKFALVDGNRVEAFKAGKGICPSCGSQLIAKCGEVKINHWAHKGIRNCDPWWEPETEWHRSWKNNFPVEWQEFPLKDQGTGEKHIADIRTGDGLVIEFQHSHIEPEERAVLAEISRKAFTRTTINGEWVIRARNYMNYISQFAQELDQLEAKRQQLETNINFQRQYRRRRFWRKGTYFN